MSAHGLASRIRSECAVLDGEIVRIVSARQRFATSADSPCRFRAVALQ